MASESPRRLRALDSGATKAPWKVSDSHGLCVRDAERNMVLDLYPASSTAAWKGRREDAELVVALRNSVGDLLEAEKIRCPMYRDRNRCGGDLHLLSAYTTDMGTWNGVDSNHKSERYECNLCRTIVSRHFEWTVK